MIVMSTELERPSFDPFTPPEAVEQQLAERIRVLRLQRDWKQSTLATRAGVSLPTVRRYERTGRTTVRNLLRLCHALGRLDEFAELLQPPPAAGFGMEFR